MTCEIPLSLAVKKGLIIKLLILQIWSFHIVYICQIVKNLLANMYNYFNKVNFFLKLCEKEKH